MKKIFTILISALIIFQSFAVCAQSDIKAQSAIVAVSDSQQILYSKAPDVKVSPGALTKIFTALVALDYLKPKAIITVDSNIADYSSDFDTGINLKPGEQISVTDLLGAMIIGSANDATYQLAISCGGVDKFVAAMNEKAKKIGLKNTKFVNPTGNYDESQYTTASDMLKIYKLAYNDDTILGLLNSVSYDTAATNLKGSRKLWTNNHLISTYYEYKYFCGFADGGKISMSSKGGYSVASSGSKSGSNIIVIIMNSPMDSNINYSLIDSAILYNQYLKNYSGVTVVNSNNLVCEAKLINASKKDHVVLTTKNSLKAFIKNTDTIEKIEKKIDVPDEISAPIKAGQTLGTVTYTYDGNFVGKVDLVAQENIKLNVFKYVGNVIKNILTSGPVKAIGFTLLILILIAFFGLVYYANQSDKKHKKKKRKPIKKNDDF